MRRNHDILVDAKVEYDGTVHLYFYFGFTMMIKWEDRITKSHTTTT